MRWPVVFVCAFAPIITIPACFPNSANIPVAFLAVTSVSVIGFYIAYVIPTYLRWRMGDSFQSGPWTLGAKYRWVNMVAVVWVAICVVIFSLPFSPLGVPWKKGFTLNSVNYAPIITLVVVIGVTIWYQVSAKKWFRGPIRTIDEPDAAPLPGVGAAP